MGQKHIGFIFNYNENWIGGSYYILNIIHALNSLPEEEKPVVSVLSPKKSDFELAKKETKYPRLNYIEFPKKPSIVARALNKLITTVFRRETSLLKTKLDGVDFVYPNYSHAIANKSIPKVYWIPDFQEAFLPHFFTKQELNRRSRNHQTVVNDAEIIVFSSQDAQSHFKKLFPTYEKRTEVLPFAVTHPVLGNSNFQEIQKKYNLPEKYYFLPNQFWIHKNHITVLKAVKQLKDKGENIAVVFSGKEHDHRATGYFESLSKFVSENGIQDNVQFLGFIDRKDQLLILKNSLAVVQPSLFEGWSTVVEDAKAMNKFLVLSNLSVHQEQLKERNAHFFEPEDVENLSQLLSGVWVQGPPETEERSYKKDIEVFGRRFLELT